MSPRRYVAATLVLLAAAGCQQAQSPTTPVDGPPIAVRYTAVGASDAIGYGGSVVCFPFAACPDGTGYVPTLARRLKATHPDFESTNLGMPGAVLSRRVQDMGNTLGLGIVANFLDSEAPFVPRNSTLVTIFAGGNDANTIAAAVRAGRHDGNVQAYVDAQIASFGEEFRALIAAIRARAASARIIVLNLPNLARLPYASGASSTEREWMRRLTVGYSAAMNATRTSNVLIVDLMCHAPIYNAGIYSSDGFHPNDAGYTILADLVSGAISAPPAAPAASCGFMN